MLKALALALLKRLAAACVAAGTWLADLHRAVREGRRIADVRAERTRGEGRVS